ncbi:MAG: hypothetical protein V1774_02910 [Candidatus Eisenbacteria bacterium]
MPATGRPGACGTCAALAAWALLCIVGRSDCRATWNVDAQALVAMGWDSNPLEWVESRYRQSDGYARLEWGLTLAEKSGASRRGPALFLRWGAERYLRESAENRHMVVTGAAWRWAARAHWVEAFAEGSARFFPQQSPADTRERGNRDFARAEGGVRGVVRAARTKVLLWRVQMAVLDKERVPLEGGATEGGSPVAERSRSAAQISTEGRWSWRPGWDALLLLDAGGIRHERPAVGAPAGDSPAEVAGCRRDGTLALGVGVARHTPISMRIVAAYERTWSNSYGVGFHRVRTDLAAAMLLPWQASLHLLVRWHLFSRQEDDAFLLDPYEDPDDPEFGERNRVLLSLTRPLGDGVAMEAQLGWQRNEAVVRLEEYEKTTVQIGFRYATGE